MLDHVGPAESLTSHHGAIPQALRDRPGTPGASHANPIRVLLACLAAAACGLHAAPGAAQQPASWNGALEFHTFSIAAVDPESGETGVAVTTRVACVGNVVPWVRAGVGAVATQARTRVEYGAELLDLIEEGVSPDHALGQAVAGDAVRARRQVGVIDIRGMSAQHTGDSTSAWAGHRAGTNYVAQGNLLVGPEVLDAVGRSFEESEGTGRHLADRLIAALSAGQAAGGDARKGRVQSAAVLVADPRPGIARRPDGITVHINVCEHPSPVAELRRTYQAVSQTLGYRTLEQFQGNDVLQLKAILSALGYFRPGPDTLGSSRADTRYDQAVIDAVDAFRLDQGLSTPVIGTPPGLVDPETVRLLWAAVEQSGQTAVVRERIRRWTQTRR